MIQSDGSARVMRAHTDLLARGRVHHFRSDRTDRVADGLKPWAGAAETPVPSGDPGAILDGAGPEHPRDEGALVRMLLAALSPGPDPPPRTE